MILHTILNENEILNKQSYVNDKKISYIDKNNIYYEIELNKKNVVLSTNPRDYLINMSVKGSN